MRILHYYLGPAPLRSGGLTKYVEDLIKAECSNGDDCFELYPVGLSLKKKMFIKRDLRRKRNNFQLVNAYPLPLIDGIGNPGDFFNGSVDHVNIKKFLMDIGPDILHVHTLMGLPLELLEIAHSLKIKVVFTSHDYFGLSPVPDFYNNRTDYSFAFENTDEQLKNWANIGELSKSVWMLRLFQLKSYPTLKKVFKILNSLLSSQRTDLGTTLNANDNLHESNKNFNSLRNYYQSLLDFVDVFHFNSFVARDVYLSNYPKISRKKSLVIPITNSEINGHQQLKMERHTNAKIKIGYLGRFTQAKGVYQLIEMFKQINNPKIELHLYGDSRSEDFHDAMIINHGQYQYKMLSNILAQIDVVVIPSEWEETFGFVTLECLSYGVPVIVSGHVGANMLLSDEYLGIYDSDEDLKEILSRLDFDFIEQLRNELKFKIPNMLDVQAAYAL